MKRLWGIVHLLFVAALVLLLWLCCFLVWHVVAVRIGATKDFWDIATAVGTVGATVSAVWIALRQDGIRREEVRVRAQMVGARLIPKLTFALDQIRSIQAALVFTDASEREAPSFVVRLLQDVVRLKLNLTNDDLAALAALPNRAGFRLAHGIGQLELFESRLNGRAFVPIHDAEKTQLLAHADEAFYAFRFALEECAMASGRLVEISNLERFGELTTDDY